MDEMRDLYQRAFEGVGPSNTLREKVFQMEKKPGRASGHYVRRLSGVMAAAIVMIALLGCGVVAVVYGDSIQNYFGYYWEAVTGQPMSEGQGAAIDHLSQEIGLSQTIGDVTVTVDSATVGDDVFILLVRVEGPKMTRRYSYGFDQVHAELSPDPIEGGGMGGFGWQQHGIDGDGAALFLMDHNYASKQGFEWDSRPLEITLTLENFVTKANTVQEEPIQEGVWEFSFTLDRSEQPRVVTLPDTEVMAHDVQQRRDVPVVLTNIELTSTGMRFRYNYEGGTVNVFAHTDAILENGAEIHFGGGTGTPMEDGETMNYSLQWSVPMDLDEVAAIRIDSTEIPVP